MQQRSRKNTEYQRIKDLFESRRNLCFSFLYKDEEKEKKMNKDKIKHNIRNVPGLMHKTLHIKQHSLKTMERYTQANLRRTNLNEYKNNFFKVRLNRNKITKYNVG